MTLSHKMTVLISQYSYVTKLCHTSYSVVADKPARRAASRQTAKIFLKNHETITTPLLL